MAELGDFLEEALKEPGEFDELFARTVYEQEVGHRIMQFVKSLEPDDILSKVNASLVSLLTEIADILSDRDPQDASACRRQILALVDAYEARGVSLRLPGRE